ncbi:hypothetical protein GCM10012288_23530 [Malaciobacter pacificus]|uniref:DUF4468 domain-containing protein n=1 Tax=Malaciobacter pacificus TaxID=1080223 RepID=A0A5C2H8J5_9BACT|nr:DUF4468 domain-containing protein [Malaciobacter pacificus]QEP33184.1 DUF4468 domain-containing protein [Malaciobacter pacificus]GGD48699.1 hypothetical protein GCM10012288_23530 [Malaciobacter pacificus]
MKFLLKIMIIGVVPLFVFIGCGQPTVPKNQLVYSKIIQHNKNSNEAFEFSKMWLANAFVDSKSVIEYENKDNFTIIGKGIIPKVYYGLTIYGDTKFTITIQNKNNRTKITLDNIKIETYDNINGTLKYDMWNQKQFNYFSIEADKLLTSFKSSLSKKTLNDNW